jgi:hypothetical protein
MVWLLGTVTGCIIDRPGHLYDEAPSYSACRCMVVVRTRSPIDWYHYTAYNLAVNPGDEYVFAEREVYRDRLSNLAQSMNPRKFVSLGPIVADVS